MKEGGFPRGNTNEQNGLAPSKVDFEQIASWGHKAPIPKSLLACNDWPTHLGNDLIQHPSSVLPNVPLGVVGVGKHLGDILDLPKNVALQVQLHIVWGLNRKHELSILPPGINTAHFYQESGLCSIVDLAFCQILRGLHHSGTKQCQCMYIGVARAGFDDCGEWAFSGCGTFVLYQRMVKQRH